jgi:hypothetical protein
MAEIVNLKSARKAKARATADQQAERNRQAFGRSKADKLAAEREQTRLETIVGGAKREPD